MRSTLVFLLVWPLAACAVDPGAPEEADLVGASEALSLGECTAPEVQDALTWSSPSATAETCDGRFDYVRFGTCSVSRAKCDGTCTRYQTCEDKSFGLDPAERVITRTETLYDVPGTCRTLCRGRPGALCDEPELICTPSLTRCTAAADAYRLANYNTSPLTGRVTSAKNTDYEETGPRKFRVQCTYQLAVRHYAARAASPCACAACTVKDPSCGTSHATTARGLTYAEASNIVATDASAAPWNPPAGIREANLTCTTCENLPLPVHEDRYVPEAHDANVAFVSAKYNCLLTQLAKLPEADLPPVERNLMLLYETWGEFLPPGTSLAPVTKAYAHAATLPDVAQCGGIVPPSVPQVCTGWVNLMATALRCERLLGDHVSQELRSQAVSSCNDALFSFRNLANSVVGCASPDYDPRMVATIRALHPDWREDTGHTASEPNLTSTATIHRTVVGAAPAGYTCPPLPQREEGWHGGLLFGARSMAEQPLGDDGAVFCRYEYTGPANQLRYADLPEQMLPCDAPGLPCSAKHSRRGARWLRPDVHEISTQAPASLFDGVRDRLAAEFLDQMDAPLASGTIDTASKVDLAILDGLADSPANETRPIAGDGHGRALAVAAYRSACPSGDGDRCPINFRTYRAFDPHGITSLSDLAVSIVRAVDDSEARGTRLVLNISLGLHPSLAYWDRPDFNYPQGVLLPAFRALKAALNYASAHGAITVAAAGNTDGVDARLDDRSDELLYPAAFDGAAGWQCEVDRTCHEVADRGLVIAAGGVTAGNGRLPNARFTSHAVPFVAPACNVALDNQLPWETTPQAELPTYCGTSFGAIGVSAVLAATWTHRPTASASELVSFVRDHGVDARTGTSACTGTECRVRMCSTLLAAGAAVTCGAHPVPALSAQLAHGFVAANTVPVTWLGAGVESARDQLCQSDVLFSGSENPDPCPDLRYATELPAGEMLSDQPPAGRCPHCVVIVVRDDDEDGEPVAGESAYFVGSVEAGEPVTSPSLKVGTQTYELGATLAPMLTHGGSFAIPLTNAGSSSGAVSGVAAFSYLKAPDETGAVTAQVDPLPIVR